MDFLSMGLAAYKTFGRDAAKRFLTPPRSVIEAACKKSGADVQKALKEREEATEQVLELIEACLDKNFVDPDPD